jgi:poly-gamma-glutamate capsule biosynthesis protein CapA/YwtB (metallophosphatase superfamily)
MEERLAPNDWLKKWTHAEVDAGADIVVMHGAPLLHGIEIYHGKPIFYDLGNFIYKLPPEPLNWESAIASVQFQGKSLKSISLRPIVLNYVGEGQPDMHNDYVNNQFIQTRGLPSPATGVRAGYILERLADLSKPFGTKFEIKDATAEI